MHRSIHWKRFFIVLGSLVLLSGSLVALNRLQAKRQSSVIKTLAAQAEVGIDGNRELRSKAIEIYEKYSKFMPQDEEASFKLAHLRLEQFKSDPTPKNTQEVITGLEQFLRKFPDHPAERRELAEIYIKLGKLRIGREHIEVLFKSPKGDWKKDVELLELASLCEQLGGDLTKAIDYLEDAIKTGKAPVRVYERTLYLLNENKGDSYREIKIANHVGELLDEKGPFLNNLEARIAVARFELIRHEIENAKRDIDYARGLPGGKNNPQVLMAAAEWEIAGIHSTADLKPRLRNALVLLQNAFAIDPKNVQIGLFLADIHAKLGELTPAVSTLRETAKSVDSINDDYWRIVDRLLDLKDQETAKALMERAQATGKDESRLQYYRGRIALINNEWMKAKTLLEEAAPNLIKLPDHHKRAMVGLGLVYKTLQNPDQELSAYRSALRDDGVFLQALIGEAEALARLGRLDEAITRYQTLVTAYQIAELRPPLARLRLLDMIRKPQENRNWAKFDSEDTLGPPEQRTSDVLIPYVQGLAIRGERDKALAILNELKKDKKNPSIAAIWVTLARIQEAGKPDAALLVLDEAQKEIGDSVDLRLARADVLIYRAKPPTPAEFEALGNGADKYPKEARYQLWLGLGQAAIKALPRLTDEKERKGLEDSIIRFLRLAGEAEPQDLHCRAVLIDFALTVDRKENLDSTINELASLEGPNGPISTLARVSIRLTEIKKQQNTDISKTLRELRELSKNVQHQRPGWGRVYVALGQIDELEGLADQAVEHYRQAINEGDRDEMVIRKTVALYRERKQDALAAGMLDELSTKMTLPTDLERYRAIFEMLNRSVPRSERPTIDRIAPASSLDSRIQLLRGSLLAAIREDVEALKAFRRAIELSDQTPETWEALIRQLVRSGDLDGAKQAMIQAEKRLLPIPPNLEAAKAAELLIKLGECHEVCGEMKAAGERYQEALHAAPKELSPNRQWIQYLLRIGQQAEGDKILDRLAEDSSPDLARWARRYLAAFSLMSKPDAYQHRGRALALIARNLAVSPNDPDDIKARAVILTVDPATREEGVQILKKYWDQGELTPDESYHLGLLIFSLGPTKIPESVRYFESAAKPRPGLTTEHIAGLIRVYSALDKLEIAEATLERLKASAPNGWESTREEARLLMKKSLQASLKGDQDDAKKFSDQARTMILNFPGQKTAEAIRTRTGPLLAELGFTADAKILYQELITLSNSPSAHAPLAILLIQTKDTAEAVKLAWKYQDRTPILMTAQIISGAVRVKRPDADLEKEVEKWLDEKIKLYAGKPELGGLLGARAELLDAQEKYKESIEEYRRAIQAGAGDTAKNNLAMLLALTEPSKVDEAIKIMTELIGIRGPVPTYLDTRAVAYIVKGGEATEKAVEDLKLARIQHARAVFAYHLAWAYDLQLKRGDRDRMLEEAQKIGLTADDLHPRERDKYYKLFGPISK